MNVWTAAIVAISTVIANAAVTYATVKRHEDWMKERGKQLDDLWTWKAVMEDRDKRGGD